MDDVKDSIRYARARLVSTSKHAEAFRFIRDKILLGASNEDILKDFRVLHKAMPDVYSIAGGNTLSREVLRKFKKGILADKSIFDRRYEQGKAVGRVLTRDAEEWFNTSPAVQFVKEHLEMGWAYGQIVSELDSLYDNDPEIYCSRQGMPITVPMISLWAKKLGYGHGLGGGNKAKMEVWKQSNEGYQWFRDQVLAGVPQDEVIAEFNELHEKRPEAYSTIMGSGMTISTYIRWRREILAESKE